MYSDIPLIKHVQNLLPLCRSITGNGIRATLKYFEKYHPEYSRIKVKTGTKVFDWEVPKEWNIKDSFIEHIETGVKYASFLDCNLHVLGYSEPIDKILDLEILKKNIYTQVDQPDWIPYITSYYEKNWGFCLSEKEKQSLPLGKYRVVIDSELKDGNLDISHALIKGKSNKEIFFSSYVCHPSMANNELSGPVVLNYILDYIKSHYPDNFFSYRFALVPETIGSITYISKFYSELKKNTICGFNLTCIGDERAYSLVHSPYSDTLADKVLESAFVGLENVKKYPFSERGSDERQYCSPGIRLPLCTMCRSKFGEYPEYHTSADNLSVVTQKGLQGSVDVIKNIVDSFETCLYPNSVIKCEPMLGKRNLYPSLSKKSKNRPAKIRTDIIAYCDGSNTIFDISNLLQIKLSEVLKEIKVLKREKLIIDKFAKR